MIANTVSSTTQTLESFGDCLYTFAPPAITNQSYEQTQDNWNNTVSLIKYLSQFINHIDSFYTSSCLPVTHPIFDLTVEVTDMLGSMSTLTG
jgi:hypothetical protein